MFVFTDHIVRELFIDLLCIHRTGRFAILRKNLAMKRIVYIILFLSVVASGQAQLVVNVSDTIACAETNIVLTASGMDSYSWSSAVVLDTNAGDSVNTEPIVGTHTITVTGTDTSGTDTLIVSIVINPNPTVVIQSSAVNDNDFVCLGNSATLTAISDTAVLASVMWSPSTALDTDSGVSVVSTPDSTIIYTATVYNDYGCSVSGTKSVKVGTSYPAFSVSADPVTICPGDSSELTATPTTVVSRFTWSPAATLSGSSGSLILAGPTTTTAYTVVGTRDGCSVDTTITLNVLVPPTLTYTQSSGGATIKLDETDIITAVCAECVSYVWKLPNSTLITTQNEQIISPNTAGANIIKIKGIDSNSCSASVNVTVNVDSSFAGTPFGLNELAKDEVKAIQKGETMVVSAGSTIRQVAIYNLLGEQVMNKAVANKSLEQISIDNLSTGVYVVLVKTDIKETALKLYLN